MLINLYVTEHGVIDEKNAYHLKKPSAPVGSQRNERPVRESVAPALLDKKGIRPRGPDIVIRELRMAPAHPLVNSDEHASALSFSITKAANKTYCS